jgi:hypothetical protein
MFNSKLSSEFVKNKNCIIIIKKAATLIVMHYTTFSVHELWYRKWIVWHMKKWSNMFYNFMNIPPWIPWKPEEFSSSFSVPRRAPYGVTFTVNTVHCQPQ